MLHLPQRGEDGPRTRLLVSVSTVTEACAALAGGADIIDAKDPGAGALGGVTPEVLASIRAAVGPARLLTAAAGDGPEAGAATLDIEARAHAYASAGARLVKVGCTAADGRAARAWLAAAVRGARRAGGEIVAVVYADAPHGAAVTLDTAIEWAREGEAHGVLVDTIDKQGPSLTSLVCADRLARWVLDARETGLLAAVAGRLVADDLPAAAASGADVVGVRGAACEGGRLGRVTAERVESLVTGLRLAGATVPDRRVSATPRP